MKKSKRLKMYEIALVAFSEKNNKDTRYGFCAYFRDVYDIDLNGILFQKTFPELYKQKPKESYEYYYGFYSHTYFWWKPCDCKVRVKALKITIAKMEK